MQYGVILRILMIDLAKDFSRSTKMNRTDIQSNRPSLLKILIPVFWLEYNNKFRVLNLNSAYQLITHKGEIER